MKILIIGAGIAGPAAALALQRAGHEPVVYEAHEGPAEWLGLFLGLGVNGMRILRQLDVLEAFEGAETIPTPLMVFSSTTGKRLGSVSNGWLDRATPSITLMRGTLQRVLSEAAVARGIEFRYGHRLSHVAEQGGSVVARFENGAEEEGHLVLGADGIHSQVRRHVVPAGHAPTYTGLLNVGGVAARSGMPPTPGTMHMVWGRRAFFGYTVRENGEAWWFANIGMKQEPGRAALAATPATEWKERLRDLFARDPGFIRDLIEATDAIGVSPIHDMPSIPRWHTDRVALLGDAAHAVSPSAGQGASLALEDALMLAKCLRDPGPAEEALGRYEDLRRPRAERIVAVGRRRGNYKALESSLAVVLRDLAMPLAFKLFATEKAVSWIYDYQIPRDDQAAGSRP